MFEISTLFVGGIPLVAVIFGLVEYVKSFGLKGPTLTALSATIGLLLGICYKIATDGLPVDWQGWFATIVFGLALGLVASGFYDFAKKRMPEVVG